MPYPPAPSFEHPHARLVGVPTGAVTGIDVLDLDPRNGSNAWREASIHRLPETRIHGTMNGGEHWLFRLPKGDRQLSAADMLEWTFTSTPPSGSTRPDAVIRRREPDDRS